MSCFALPVSFCNKMRSIISRFWWSGTNDKRKIPWVSWNAICKPKKKGGLDFRNLRAFNIAMLAKQGWKLIQFPNSLCAKVLKDKYYPSTDFTEAGPRRQASYLWQSIIEGKCVLDSGLAWRVGNGESVRVLEDNWITSAAVMKPLGSINVPAGCMVSSLIVDGEWNVAKLPEFFSPGDVDNIVKIPLSRRLPPDKIFWYHSNNGFYSVKTGYYQACKLLERNNASTSSIPASDELWGRIWRCPVQPKIRHFLWRINHDALPCNANLAVRIPELPTACPRCETEVETQLYALKECEAVRGLWLQSPLNLRVDSFQCNSLKEWLTQMFNALKSDELRIFVMSLWTIWNDRNNVVFGNYRLPVERLFQHVLSTQGDQTSSDRRSKALRPVEALAWTPPPENHLKVNCDAAVSVQRNFSVVSGVCRDSNGHVKRWGVSVLPGITEVEMAEAKAMLFGLNLASAIPWTVLHVESDSANVISRLSKTNNAIDPIQTIIDDCTTVVDSRDVHFQHIRRHCNQVAHALGK